MGRLNIRTASLITALMLVSSVFVGCTGSSEDISGDNNNVAPQITKTEGTSVSGNLGEQVVNENIGITLKNVYKMDIESSDKTYVALYVEIVNQSDEERTFADFTHFGIRIDGATEDNIEAISPSNAQLYVQKHTDFNTLNGTVASNTMLDGLVTAVVPNDFQECTLVFYPNAATTTGEITFTFTASDFEDLPTND
jgi:hypothetical protein